VRAHTPGILNSLLPTQHYPFLSSPPPPGTCSVACFSFVNRHGLEEFWITRAKADHIVLTIAILRVWYRDIVERDVLGDFKSLDVNVPVLLIHFQSPQLGSWALTGMSFGQPHSLIRGSIIIAHGRSLTTKGFGGGGPWAILKDRDDAAATRSPTCAESTPPFKKAVLSCGPTAYRSTMPSKSNRLYGMLRLSCSPLLVPFVFRSDLGRSMPTREVQQMSTSSECVYFKRKYSTTKAKIFSTVLFL
jgi:hypothetical protein